MPKLLYEEVAEIYHYTTITGLKGIVESQNLWATHYAYLNDAEEVKHFNERLKLVLRPVLEKIFADFKNSAPDKYEHLGRGHGAIAKLIDNEANTLVTILYRTLLDDFDSGPYITSFCRAPTEKEQKHGLLSQWRAYGPDGGCAVAFGTKEIHDLLKLEQDKWAYAALGGGDVVYSDEDERLQEEIGQYMDNIKASFTRFYEIIMSRGLQGQEEAERALDGIYPAIWPCSCRYKHWGFKEEKEVRLVAIGQALETRRLAEEDGLRLKPEKPKKHFLRRGTAVPYIELFDGIPTPSKHRLPIKGVIVGPHPEKQKRAKAIEILLREHQIDAPAAYSDIPYLGA